MIPLILAFSHKGRRDRISASGDVYFLPSVISLSPITYLLGGMPNGEGIDQSNRGTVRIPPRSL